MARYLRDGGARASPAARERGTGGAVALCSLTTIVGYSSLLLAKNVGLFLFGVLAVLGELTCLVTAIIVLPAVLLLVRPSPSPRLPAFEWDKPTGVTAAEVIPPAPAPAPSPDVGS